MTDKNYTKTLKHDIKPLQHVQQFYYNITDMYTCVYYNSLADTQTCNRNAENHRKYMSEYALIYY